MGDLNCEDGSSSEDSHDTEHSCPGRFMNGSRTNPKVFSADDKLTASRT